MYIYCRKRGEKKISNTNMNCDHSVGSALLAFITTYDNSQKGQRSFNSDIKYYL